MSRNRKRNRSKAEAAPVEEPPRRRRWGTIAAVFGLAVVAVVAWYAWPGVRGGRQPPATPAPTPPAKSPAPAEATPPAAPQTPPVDSTGRAETEPARHQEPLRTDLSPARVRALQGRWGRTDGDYVIEIRKVDPDGRVEAAYFNPRPIRVSQASAAQEGATTKVFIELRDTGYPGCTYRLGYDPQTDSLQGVYYQAAMQQQYDVIFVRLP